MSCCKTDLFLCKPSLYSRVPLLSVLRLWTHISFSKQYPSTLKRYGNTCLIQQLWTHSSQCKQKDEGGPIITGQALESVDNIISKKSQSWKNLIFYVDFSCCIIQSYHWFMEAQQLSEIKQVHFPNVSLFGSPETLYIVDDGHKQSKAGACFLAGVLHFSVR